MKNNETIHRSDVRGTDDDGIRFFRGLMIAGLLSPILWPILIAVGYGGYVFIRMIFEFFQG